MLLIELNPKSTWPETEFNTATPKFVANRNRITLPIGRQPLWVVIGVAEGTKEIEKFVELHLLPSRSSKVRQKNV